MQANNKYQPKNSVPDTFYSNGAVKAQSTFKNGVKHGLAETFYQNGTIKFRVNYENNLKQGFYYKFYKDGTIKTQTMFQNNVKQGLEESFYRDNSIQQRVNYENNLKQGLCITFYTKYRYSTQEFINGVKIPNSIKLYEDDVQETECSICLEQITITLLTPCGHIYCRDCFLKLPLQLDHVICPLCQQTCKPQKTQTN